MTSGRYGTTHRNLAQHELTAPLAALNGLTLHPLHIALHTRPLLRIVDILHPRSGVGRFECFGCISLSPVRAEGAGAHLEERAQRRALQAEVNELRQAAETEKEAHRHAVQQYVAEVELRAQLQADLATERGAKEHAVFLRSNAEEKNRQLQVRTDPLSQL